MTINYLTIHQVVKSAMPAFIGHEDRIEEIGDNALTIFKNPPISHEELRSRSDALFASMARMMRWAGPTEEQFNAQFPAADLPNDFVLTAVDGSQQLPDMKGVLPWGLVNTAAMIWPTHAGKFQEMKKIIDTILFLENSLFSSNGETVTESHISLLRDNREREALADHSIPGAFALGDGPLELWGAYDASLSGDYLPSLHQAVAAYARMRESRVVYAGYVDDPHSDLLIRLLDIACTAQLPLSEFRREWRNRHFPGVTDGKLLEGWLAPGKRTAVFRLMTQAKGSYGDQSDLAVHLFFLNVGWEGNPHIARIDIPAYLVPNQQLIGQLHAVVLDQCRKSGSNPYPYILMRADEEARVKPEDVDTVNNMLIAEYLRYRESIPSPSPKKALKILTRGWRHAA